MKALAICAVTIGPDTKFDVDRLLPESPVRAYESISRESKDGSRSVMLPASAAAVAVKRN